MPNGQKMLTAENLRTLEREARERLEQMKKGHDGDGQMLITPAPAKK